MAVHIQTTSLDGALAAFREGEVKLLTEIATALAEFKEADEDRRRLLDIAQDLREMFFLVVVIGEFNAGKSSFLNALMGEELLAMGITPTTDSIHVIRYNENSNRKANVREDGIYEWTHPNTIAAGVALVDTPGTGSVFQKHEKIAKQFLHRSDLVIFVISAKRAFAETERLYLELAKNYGKKIILVVNQTDLLNPNELREVRNFVERQAKELLDFEPLIFLVSAKEALQARRNGQPDAGGIDAVKAHLRGVLSEAPPAKQKLLAQLDTADRTVKHYFDEAKSKYDLIGADTTKVRDIQRELETQSGGLNAQLSRARADIDAVFEGMRMRGLEFINKYLSLRNIGRGLNRESLQAEFTETVVGQATRDIETATNDYINVLIDNSRQYWRGVISRLNQLRDLMQQEIGGLRRGHVRRTARSPRRCDPHRRKRTQKLFDGARHRGNAGNLRHEHQWLFDRLQRRRDRHARHDSGHRRPRPGRRVGRRRDPRRRPGRRAGWVLRLPLLSPRGTRYQRRHE